MPFVVQGIRFEAEGVRAWGARLSLKASCTEMAYLGALTELQ